MTLRSFLASCLATTIGLSALADDKPIVAPVTRVLPGVRKDGFVQLPNQWKLNPAGRQIDIGDLPVNIQIHPTGLFAAVLHCGYKEHEVAIIDLIPKAQKVVSRTIIPQAFYGITFSPDGKQLYASSGEFDRVHVWDFNQGLLNNARTLSIVDGKQRMVTGGMSFDATGANLYCAAVWADAIVKIPLANPENRTVIKLCAVSRCASSAGVSPARQRSFQPVAFGAMREVTNSSKPSRERVAFGDSARRQAVT